MRFVKTFKKLRDYGRAGGKGGTLARLYQKKYRTPNGFVIFPKAFERDELKQEAHDEIIALLHHFRKAESFSVRASPLAENSMREWFSGKLDTFLDIKTDGGLLEAIRDVRKSRHRIRVRDDSRVQDLPDEHEVAVVVHEMVKSDISGVLFTADPETAGREKMKGSFIYGLGDKFVSGKLKSEDFTIEKANGEYDGPKAVGHFAEELVRLGRKLEKDFGAPQEIEWAVNGKKLYLLQSRPITIFIVHDAMTHRWNYSHLEEQLWTVREDFPSTVTPGTWSIWETHNGRGAARTERLGNIAGRVYTNSSAVYSAFQNSGRSHEEALELMEISGVPVPENASFPEHRRRILHAFGAFWSAIKRRIFRQIRLKLRFRKAVETSPERHRSIMHLLGEVETEKSLAALWSDVYSYFKDMLILFNSVKDSHADLYMSLRRKLSNRFGEDTAGKLMGSLGAGSGGLTLALSRLAKEEITQEEYLAKYGHRCPGENELSEMRPHEDPGMIDSMVDKYRKSGADAHSLIEKQAGEFEALWEKFKKESGWRARFYLKKRRKLEWFLERRRNVRSELVRSVDAVRQFFLKAGEVTGLGEDVFYMTCEELLDVLSGDRAVVRYIPGRRELYSKYRSLPEYPCWIDGRFNPFEWAEESGKGSLHGMEAPAVEGNTLKGSSGSPGDAEGVVIILKSPKQRGNLKEGDILVVRTAGMEWVPLVPLVKGIVTEVGSPVSQTVLAARTMGVPAVVGCAGASGHVKSGDKIRISGTKGIVEIL